MADDTGLGIVRRVYPRGWTQEQIDAAEKNRIAKEGTHAAQPGGPSCESASTSKATFHGTSRCGSAKTGSAANDRGTSSSDGGGDEGGIGVEAWKKIYRTAKKFALASPCIQQSRKPLDKILAAITADDRRVLEGSVADFSEAVERRYNRYLTKTAKDNEKTVFQQTWEKIFDRAGYELTDKPLLANPLGFYSLTSKDGDTKISVSVWEHGSMEVYYAPLTKYGEPPHCKVDFSSDDFLSQIDPKPKNFGPTPLSLEPTFRTDWKDPKAPIEVSWKDPAMARHFYSHWDFTQILSERINRGYEGSADLEQRKWALAELWREENHGIVTLPRLQAEKE